MRRQPRPRSASPKDRTTAAAPAFRPIAGAGTTRAGSRRGTRSARAPSSRAPAAARGPARGLPRHPGRRTSSAGSRSAGRAADQQGRHRFLRMLSKEDIGCPPRQVEVCAADVSRRYSARSELLRRCSATARYANRRTMRADTFAARDGDDYSTSTVEGMADSPWPASRTTFLCSRFP